MVTTERKLDLVQMSVCDDEKVYQSKWDFDSNEVELVEFGVTTNEHLNGYYKDLNDLGLVKESLLTKTLSQKMGPDVIWMPAGKGNYQIMWAFDEPNERVRKVYDLTINPENGWLVLNGKDLRKTRFTKGW